MSFVQERILDTVSISEIVPNKVFNNIKYNTHKNLNLVSFLIFLFDIPYVTLRLLSD